MAAATRPRLIWRPLQPGELDHERLWSLLFALGVGLGFAIPEQLRLAFRCPFKQLTHLPCLGCGSNRALSALLELDLAAALQMNPLVASALIGWGIYSVYGAVVTLAHLPRLRLHGSWRTGRPMLVTLFLAIFVLNWLYLWLAGI